MSLNFDTLFGPYSDKSFTVNYDWTDIDSATGYVCYDGIRTNSDTEGDKYWLMKTSEFYDLRSYYDTTTVTSDSTESKDIDIDFDTSILQKPRIIRGDATVHFNSQMVVPLGSHMNSGYQVVRIRKYNADTLTETEIANVTVNTWAVYGDDDDVNFDNTVHLTIPETVIAARECIRVTIEIWVSVHSTCSTKLYHSPELGRDNNARVIFICPFKIDQGD